MNNPLCDGTVTWFKRSAGMRVREKEVYFSSGEYRYSNCKKGFTKLGSGSEAGDDENLFLSVTVLKH